MVQNSFKKDQLPLSFYASGLNLHFQVKFLKIIIVFEYIFPYQIHYLTDTYFLVNGSTQCPSLLFKNKSLHKILIALLLHSLVFNKKTGYSRRKYDSIYMAPARQWSVQNFSSTLCRKVKQWFSCNWGIGSPADLSGRNGSLSANQLK